MNIYRFRKIEHLLGEFQELEKQSIYFAGPEELNDPMEGFRDIFWQGDEIVWTNFFKHYLCCLNQTFCLLKLTANSDKWDPNDIPVLQRWDQHPTPEFANLFNDICRRVFEKEGLDDCIVKIANTNCKIRYEGVLFYLYWIHFTALLEIQEAHINHGLSPENGRLFAGSLPGLRELNESGFFEQIQKTEDETLHDLLFEKINQVRAGLSLILKSNYRSEYQSTFEENLQLFIDFPQAYLKQRDRLLYPKWYTACFMKDYQNSSAWGHYGDGHKGVCLIFEVESKDERNSLTLNQTPHSFYEINYQDKAGETDFFRSVGWWLPRSDLIASWYSDQNRNLSECAAHLGSDGDEDSWRKSYWNIFSRDITIKTKDWKYEQESRLILDGTSHDLDDKRRRTLAYNFNSLKGIIFGINTSESDKLEIIEIVQRKCQENNRTEFEFYQAYYCHKNGDIRKREIPLLSKVSKAMNQVTP